MDNQTPKSLDEIVNLRVPVRNVNIEHKQKLSRMDKLALWITNHVGSMGFFMIIFAWTFLWMSWNIFVKDIFHAEAFDAYPAFVGWLFISNVIQIFLLPLIMIGQNLQSRHSEARAEADFEVDTKAEMEIKNILMHLENQNKLIMQLLKTGQAENDKKDSLL